MAIFEATIPQIPQLPVAILASGPVDFRWAPSMSEESRDQLSALPLALRNASYW